MPRVGVALLTGHFVVRYEPTGLSPYLIDIYWRREQRGECFMVEFEAAQLFGMGFGTAGSRDMKHLLRLTKTPIHRPVHARPCQSGRVIRRGFLTGNNLTRRRRRDSMAVISGA